MEQNSQLISWSISSVLLVIDFLPFKINLFQFASLNRSHKLVILFFFLLINDSRFVTFIFIFISYVLNIFQRLLQKQTRRLLVIAVVCLAIRQRPFFLVLDFNIEFFIFKAKIKILLLVLLLLLFCRDEKIRSYTHSLSWNWLLSILITLLLLILVLNKINSCIF